MKEFLKNQLVLLTFQVFKCLHSPQALKDFKGTAMMMSYVFSNAFSVGANLGKNQACMASRNLKSSLGKRLLLLLLNMIADAS